MKYIDIFDKDNNLIGNVKEKQQPKYLINKKIKIRKFY